ncbi:hypothetical protein NM688_g5837 [Phlebia brevispora]|uniref:Uncharacterized protein n=1 Tax=Phlebia brevispora TaxID=194682 RepID=A0ACC1SP88_9APHY|nr:hypothetical protein NM688_g5837 [Phlebia brevispora]
MKSLRKSLNGHRDPHITSPLPPLSRPLTAIQPPKKVIRAIAPYKAVAPQELSFEKGDFFHVMNDAPQGQWYEAHNPVSGARGLVPRSYFEEFTKGGAMPRTPMPTPGNRPESPSSPKLQAFYAIVQHDFAAERADELDAKAGDAITVVAQSNREWFVAKPIGKLGRPGLIPVSFVEIRDPATNSPVHDVDTLIDSGALPRVEEWKKAMMSYKANSISLGVIDGAGTPQTTSFVSAGNMVASTKDPAINVQGPSPHTYQQSEPRSDSAPSNLLPPGILISAEVKSFHYEMDEYWFRVHATYQPFAGDHLPQAKQLVLFRSYNDFYDFQVELLNTFPAEAGRHNTERILPYMPGPAAHVDSEVTASRREELDEYLRQLCQLRHAARYILEHRLVREFLSLKPGDADVDTDPCVHELEELDSYPVDQLSRMSLSNSADSGYAEGGPHESYRESSYNNGRERVSRPVMDYQQRKDSTTSSIYVKSNGNGSYSRPGSRMDVGGGRVESRNYSSLEIDPHRANGYSRSSVASSNDPSPIRSSIAPSVSSGTSVSGRSRSQSIANNPPISASIPQTAFIKIKVMHERKNDLVAIRVHPKVTYAQLLDKIQVRLGDEDINLRYRDSMSNDFVPLESDIGLKDWLDSTDRHLLYA